ncbi:hypothetical protein [Burkholderia sp. LMG 32019]|uniref:hypothetical protein n=1 Tax=Burkholderia sp. LMG 32019 TaxID=3158173 RepID=UPI003C2BEB0C
MDDTHSDTYHENMFKKFCNLAEIVGRGKQVLFRYLGQDDEYVYLVEIGSATNGIVRLNPNPSNKKYRSKRPVSEVRSLVTRERIKRITERGLPAAMTMLSPDEAVKKSLAEKRKVVDYITRVYGDETFMRPKIYSDAVSDAVKIFGLDAKTVRKYYERNLFYGGHEYALVDHNWEKGAPGVSRHGAKREDGTLIESGRRTYAQTLDRLSKFPRKMFPERLRASLTKFVRANAHEPGTTVTIIVRRFFRGLRGHNRAVDGSTQSFPVDPRKLPPEANAVRIATPILKEERARLAVLKDSARGKGYSAQIADGDFNVVDIDGTVADCFLRYGDSRIEIDGVLKPTVLLAIDRSSRAIVGWYVTYRKENADAYLACVFSACTDKEVELARWQVSHLDGMVYGCPSAIFVDRGPGISEKVRNALVTGMRMRQLMAAPGSPQSKGDVEQAMDFFQEEVARISGSTYGEPVKGKGPDKDAARERNRTKLRWAPGTATLTLAEFMKALLTAISRHNLTADVTRLRTDLMLEGNVPPVPKQMFLFNKAMRDGDAAWDMTEEEVIRRLAKPFYGREAPGGIITLGNMSFTSDELRKSAIEFEAYNNGRTLTINGFELFTSDLHALWDDDGYLVELQGTPLTKKRYGLTYPDICDYISMRGPSDLVKERDKHRKHPTAEQAVKSDRVSQSMQKKMEAADGVKRTVNNRNVRKAAVEESGAADTRALLGAVRGALTVAPAPTQIVRVEEEIFVDDEQELDIDF